MGAHSTHNRRGGVTDFSTCHGGIQNFGLRELRILASKFLLAKKYHFGRRRDRPLHTYKRYVFYVSGKSPNLHSNTLRSDDIENGLEGLTTFSMLSLLSYEMLNFVT